MKVLNIGSLNVDYYYNVDHIVRPGETITSLQRNVYSGGKGLNQSVAMAKAGVDIYHAGIIGNDGDILMRALEEYGVNSKFIDRIDAPGGHTIVQVDKNGQNSIIFFGGTNLMLSKEYITNLLDQFEKRDFVVIQNETNLIDFIMKAAHDRDMQIVYNPSPYDESVNDLPLHLVDYLVINETEGEAITGISDQDKVIESLTARYKDMKIVLTLGENGSGYYDGTQTFYQPAVKVTAIDTSAAGDTYLGYFIQGVIDGKGPQETIEWATKACAITVSRAGSSQSVPYYYEII